MSQPDDLGEPFIAALERELVIAAARPLRVRAARLPRPRGSVTIPLAVVAVALAVASAALVLPRSREAHVGARPSGHPTTASHGGARTAPAMIGAPPPESPLLRSLVRPNRRLAAALGVLRRPQGPADRAMPAITGSLPGHVVRPLTRLLTDLPGGQRLYLAVLASPRANPQTLTIGAAQLCLLALGANAQNYTCAAAQSQLLAPPWSYSPGPGELVELVPAGVIRARWAFEHSSGTPGTITVTPKLTGSVAQTPNSFAYGSPVSVTWYLAGGRAVKAFSPTRMPPMPRAAVLAGDGIGSLRFGASPTAVRRFLRALLGRPITRPRATSACRIDHVIEVLGLAVFFSRNRFVGYGYGPPPPRRRGSAAPDLPQLETQHGLSLGETTARARRLYGAAFRLSAAQGGSWSLSTDRGRIYGFTTGVRSGRIETIDAGYVGCAAMTP